MAIVNSFNELMPGHVHLQPLCQAIKMGVAEAGGTPLEFPSIAVCDGLATGHRGMRMPMPNHSKMALINQCSVFILKFLCYIVISVFILKLSVH